MLCACNTRHPCCARHTRNGPSKQAKHQQNLCGVSERTCSISPRTLRKRVSTASPLLTPQIGLHSGTTQACFHAGGKPWTDSKPPLRSPNVSTVRQVTNGAAFQARSKTAPMLPQESQRTMIGFNLDQREAHHDRRYGWRDIWIVSHGKTPELGLCCVR